ncbi:hypothetical protein [Rhodococcus erythropolis]|uniref:hypothetical protein n=1 Tax=Rhodococcus erythropolis TaxID=1833 RepID=UPI0030136FAB
MSEKYPIAINTELTRQYWSSEARSSDDPEQKTLATRLMANLAMRRVVKFASHDSNGGDAS